MIKIEDMNNAYLDCRKKKRNTANAIKFEIDAAANLVILVNEINDRSYRVSRSISFVVTTPRYREVFAADFRDRIVHHYIAIRLMPLIELQMNERSYNCRVGKGTLAGVQQLVEDVRICSEGYTSDCYVAKGDVQGFFMNIRRSMLSNKVDDFIVSNYYGEDKEDLRWLAHVTITNAPEKNCIRQSPDELWKHIPKSKSLFTNGEDLGLPIGNLPSQMLANFLMDLIDWKMEECYIIYHGRYVDDFYIVSKDKELILHTMSVIRQTLDVIGLTLHPYKFYIQHYSKGIQFTGTIVKPHRSYTVERTVESFNKSVRQLEKANSKREIIHYVDVVNSYLGTMSHTDSFAIRRMVLTNADIYDKVTIPSGFNKLRLRKKYRENAGRKKIRNYPYIFLKEVAQ